jgi:solute carrier family 25 carnitine/acylcarnitine transporter 20/29
MAAGPDAIEEGGLARTLKDLFAGAVGGVAQVLLGMLFPFSDCEESFSG